MAIVDGMFVTDSNKMFSDQPSNGSKKTTKLSSLFDTKAPKLQKWSNGAGIGKSNIFSEKKNNQGNEVGNIPLNTFDFSVDRFTKNPNNEIAFGGINSTGNFIQDAGHLASLNDTQGKIKESLGMNNPIKMGTRVAQFAQSPTSALVGVATDFVSQFAKNPQAQKVQAQANQRAKTKNWKGASREELFMAPVGTRIPTRLSQTTNKYGGKECAEWVNDVTGAGLGSSFQSKLAKMNSRVGKIGSIAVWQPSSNPVLQKYGHVGIIVGDDGQGNWLIKSSNYKVDGSITVDKIPKSKINGYRDTNLGRLIGGQNATPTPVTDVQWKSQVTKNLAPVQQTALTSFENMLGKNIWNTKVGSAIIDRVNLGNFSGAGSLIKAFATGASVQEAAQRKHEARMLTSHDRSMSGKGGTAQ